MVERGLQQSPKRLPAADPAGVTHLSPGHRPGKRAAPIGSPEGATQIIYEKTTVHSGRKNRIMAQSLAKVYLHSIFSTKHRESLIAPEMEDRLYGYIAGIIKKVGGYPVKINGMPDHVHILSTLPRTITVAKYLEEIKKNSSKWVKVEYPEWKNFAWQGGYATFSVSSSKVDTVSNYIENQKEHHKKLTFQEELIQFLERYGVDYDEKYLWD